MRRKCPSCKEKTISVFQLVLLNRNTRCSGCRILVGAHWLIGTLIFFVAFLSVLFVAFILLNEFGIGAKSAIAIVAIWAVAEFMRVSVVPLECKEQKR